MQVKIKFWDGTEKTIADIEKIDVCGYLEARMYEYDGDLFFETDFGLEISPTNTEGLMLKIRGSLK